MATHVQPLPDEIITDLEELDIFRAEEKKRLEEAQANDAKPEKKEDAYIDLQIHVIASHLNVSLKRSYHPEVTLESVLLSQENNLEAPYTKMLFMEGDVAPPLTKKVGELDKHVEICVYVLGDVTTDYEWLGECQHFMTDNSSKGPQQPLHNRVWWRTRVGYLGVEAREQLTVIAGSGWARTRGHV